MSIDDNSRDQEKLANVPKTDDFVEGGRKGWLTVLGGFFALFNSFGFINALGVFQIQFEQDQLRTYSASTISWILSLQICLLCFGSVIFGPLFDWYGPRMLLWAGGFLVVFGMMMLSLSTQYYQYILTLGIVVSLGLSINFTCALTSVSTHFRAKRPAAIGIVATGSSLGGVLYPIMLKKMIDSIGFPWAVRVTGFVMLFSEIIIVSTITSRLPHTGYQKGRKFFAFHAFKERVFLYLACACFFGFFGLFGTFTFLPSFASASGMSSDLSFYTITFINAGSIFGRLVPPIVAGRWVGPFNMISVMLFLTGVLVLTMWLNATNQATIIAYGVLYGFFSGAFISLYAALIPLISPIQELGARFGTISLLNGCAALASLPASGAMIRAPSEYAFGFWPLIVFSGLCLLVGSFFYTMAKLEYGHYKVFVKV